jgi:hypothetical protein
MPEKFSDTIKEAMNTVANTGLGTPNVEFVEDGQRVSSPRMDPSVMNFIMLASIASQQIRIRRGIEEHNRKESFEGKLDPRTLEATSERQCLSLMERWPFTPWVSAFFINDGPNEVYIRINRSELVKVKVGETRTINHIHAEERIEQVYYHCDEGETASLRIEAYY